jgi:hypothetical protein
MRSEEEILEIVHARAAELRAGRRRRFRLVTTLAASAVLAIAVAVNLESSGAPRGLVTEGPTTSETAPDPTSPETTGATEVEPSTTLTVAGPPAVLSPQTTTDPTPRCPLEALTLSAALDRATYQPGDVIHITVTLANESDSPCWVLNKHEETTDPVCLPTAGVHHGFEGDETEPQYNAFLGPFNRASCETREVVPPHGAVTVVIDAPFETGAPNDDRYYLRTGTWTVGVGWELIDWNIDGPEKGVTLTFECPEPGCRKGSFDNLPPGDTMGGA